MSGQLRLAELLGGLSIAADLGFGLEPEEAMRSCLIATAFARHQGLGEDEVADAFYTALLVHVGCTALSHESAAAFGDDLALMRAVASTNVADPKDVEGTLVPELTRGMDPARASAVASFSVEQGRAFGRMFDTGSCEVASATARRVGLGESVQRALREVVEWWNGDGPPEGLAGDEISLPARVARVAADAAHFDRIGGEAAVIAALEARKGVILDPALVDAFGPAAAALLGEARRGDPRERILEAEPAPVAEVDATKLSEVAAAFGDVSDLKTPWMHGHSAATAGLAAEAGGRLGLDRRTLSRLEVAALLHDLGRVAISNAIWEKPGPLTAAEWEQVRMHAYHSERILATTPSFEPMARTAGMHHERLDGSGYHRGCRGAELPPDARVLAAADAFCAMTADRPHRAALAGERAAEELKRGVREGGLDREAVGAVLDAAGERRPRRRDNLRPGGLSEREVEVLRLVAEGCSNPEIAERLVISRRTAEHHVQHIYAKVGLSSRAGLALFAHEHELVGGAAKR